MLSFFISTKKLNIDFIHKFIFTIIIRTMTIKNINKNVFITKENNFCFVIKKCFHIIF